MNAGDMKEKLAADGAEPAELNSPAQFKVAISKEIDKWAKVIKAEGLKF